MTDIKPTMVAVPLAMAKSMNQVVQNQNPAGKSLGIEKVVAGSAEIEAHSAQVPVANDVKLQAAIASMSDYVQSVHRDLQFSVDDDTDTMVVKVTDGETGELIRQIPGELFLELARKLEEEGNFRLVDAAG